MIALLRRRLAALCGTGPLPHPAAQSQYPKGGRVGERAAAASKRALSRVSTRETKRPHVVVVGGGFGGLAAVQSLRRAPVDVTLVDRRNHHLFQPLLYQVATAGLSPAEIAAPIRAILRNQRNTRVVLDEVTGIDADRQLLRLAHGNPIAFDWLILATGARHSYFGNPGWAAHAPGLKSLDDALAIRRRVLLALERAETELDRERRKALLTFVVIGGGPTGVEMAGAIAELARKSVSRDFRSITPHCSRVVLVEAGPGLLPTFTRRLSAHAEAAVRGLGVELRTGAPVKAIEAERLQVGDEWIRAATIIWAAGVEASPAARWLGAAADRAGRVQVDAELRVHPQIFAIGDTACATGADGRPLPGIAPVAKQQGQYVARAILTLEAGRTPPRFAYRDAGKLATIGRSRAIVEMGPLRLSGHAAWLLWCVAHLYFLTGFRNRLTVGLGWLWSYFTFARGARLITGDAEPPPPERLSAAA